MTNNKNINNELINSDDIRFYIACDIKHYVQALKYAHIEISKHKVCEMVKDLMDYFYEGWQKLDMVEQIKRLEQINTILEQETGLSAKN